MSNFGSMGSSPGGGGGGGSSNGANGGNGAAGQVKLSYTPSTVPATNVLRFVLKIPAAGGVDGSILAQILTAGTVAKLNVVYHTGGKLELIGYNAGGSSIFDSGSQSFSADGSLMMVSAELTTSGSNVAWKLSAILPNAVSPIATYTGTVAGSVNGVNTFNGNVSGTDTGTTVVGHVTVQYAVVPLTDLAAPLGAYAGELAGDRFTRLCAEEGWGSILTGNASDTPAMGPQTDEPVGTMLQEIEDLDRGLLYETFSQFGLGYRTRVSMQNQTAKVAFDYSLAQLYGSLEPTHDDQLTRNDIIVTRTGGSSARAELTSGSLSINDPPNGVGDYSYSLTVNANADSQLANLSSWMLTVGTVDEHRYPVITADLRRSQVANLFAEIPALIPGDYLSITNPPSFLPSGTIKQLAYGFTEYLNAYEWTISINGVPESPYEGGGLPTW